MNVEYLEKYRTMGGKKEMLEKLNDKGMEGKKSSGIDTTEVLEPTTLKLPSRVH
jgi:hypothetical protein